MSRKRRTESRSLWLVFAAILVSWWSPDGVRAQSTRRHALYRNDQPPGAIGYHQLLRGEPFLGHAQAVRVILPDGAVLEVAQGGAFTELPDDHTRIVLQVGSVYRWSVRNIPNREGMTLYPSLELIDGLGAIGPAGVGATRDTATLTVALDSEDLLAAASGDLVTRVIFVEDPRNPVVPTATPAGRLEVFDVSDLEDPLHIADELGRPLAILRIGSIQPGDNGPDDTFCFGYPHLEVVAVAEQGCEEFSGAAIGTESTPIIIQTAESACEGSALPCPTPRARRDEFVCDGGDQWTSSRRLASGELRGVDSEDTVALFRGEDGEQHVEASNSVCIHSPRLAATRKITRLVQAELRQEAGGLDVQQTAWAAEDRRRGVTFRQLEQAEVQIADRVRHTLQDRSIGLLTENIIRPEEASDRILPLEGLSIVQTGAVSIPQRVEVAIGEQNYVDWTAVASAEVILDDQVALEQRGLRATNEGVAYETRGGARLRLVKLASRREAKPGELVKFTLRFDNVGSQMIYDFTLVDRLIHRLEFVPESAQCSLPAEFESQPTDDESTLLRWTLNDSLAPGTGGTVSFECRVR